MGAMDPEGAKPDARAAGVAAEQHGVVSFQQLLDVGLSATAVRERLRKGFLHRVHRGVYAFGHPAISFEGRCMAASLALRPRASSSSERISGPASAAFVSHRSAAALWRLLPSARGPIDVTVTTGGGRRSRAGLRVHRSYTLTADATTRKKGIPVTTPQRTLLDMRRTCSEVELRAAVREAELRGIAVEDVGGDRTRSELERLFLRLCTREGIPPPLVNARVAGLVVDFFWPRQRLVVETDGYRYHRGRIAFEEDRVRDLRLRASGHQVLRLTHRQVTSEGQAVARVLRRALRD